MCLQCAHSFTCMNWHSFGNNHDILRSTMYEAQYKLFYRLHLLAEVQNPLFLHHQTYTFIKEILEPVFLGKDMTKYVYHPVYHVS